MSVSRPNPSGLLYRKGTPKYVFLLSLLPVIYFISMPVIGDMPVNMRIYRAVVELFSFPMVLLSATMLVFSVLLLIKKRQPLFYSVAALLMTTLFYLYLFWQE